MEIAGVELDHGRAARPRGYAAGAAEKRYSLAVAAGPQLYADIDLVHAQRLTTESASSIASLAAVSCRALSC